jgi:hypothetical protein
METVRSLDEIPGFNIDRVAARVGDDPEVLRMENLDTDVPPPVAALDGLPGRRGRGRRKQLAAVQPPRGSQGGGR